MIKRILGFISVVGMLSVTGWLIFSLLTNSGIIFPEGKPVPANMPKLEYSSHTKLEYPKIESGDSEIPNQPPAPAPLPATAPTPTTEPEAEPESSFSPLCDPFDGMELSLIILSIREDTMVLPLYLKTHGEVIPGLVPPPDDSKSTEFHAQLGYVKSNSCGLQGFEDRLYCMFTISPNMPGSLADLYIYKNECEDPVYIQLNLSIPELRAPENEKPQCKIDLEKGDCEAAGGTMSNDAAGAPICDCP